MYAGGPFVSLYERTTVEGLATTAEVADYLKVKPNTLDHWASENRGPAYSKIEGHRRYAWKDVLAYVEARKVRHDR